MSYVMQNRLGVMIILGIFITCLYISEGFVIQAQADIKQRSQDEIDLVKEGWIYDDETRTWSKDVPYNATSSNESKGDFDVMGAIGDFIGGVGAILGFATFTAIEMPFYASLILTIVVGICFTIQAYIIYSYVYDTIKALPFT